MARKLSDIPNTTPINADYPNGKINDDTGSGNGTPVNEAVNGDIVQFFQKLLMGASITANTLPDNDGNGYQLIDALDIRIRDKMPPIDAWHNMTSGGNYDVDYRKTNLNTLQMKIQLSVGYPATNTIFTLPSGYRPITEIVMPIADSFSIIIQTDGVVKAGANSAQGDSGSLTSYMFVEIPLD